MTTVLLCVGKLKEAYWRAAAEEYVKRLRRFGPISIVECADLPEPKKRVARHNPKPRRQRRRIPARQPAAARLRRGAVHRRQSAKLSRICRKPCAHRAIRRCPGRVRHRRFQWAVRGSGAPCRRASFFFSDDVPAPACTGVAAGTALPRPQNSFKRNLSQIAS